MKGCPEFGCLRLSNLEDAKEICIQDKTCNGVVSCPYSECKRKNVHLPNMSFQKTKLIDIVFYYWKRSYICWNYIDKPSLYPSHVVDVENESIMGSFGGTVSLKCFVKSFPRAITFWIKESNHPEYFDRLIEEG